MQITDIPATTTDAYDLTHYDATPAELLAAYRDAIVREYRSIDDPLDRHGMAVAEQAALERLVAFTTDMRGRAVAELHGEGWSYGQIAKALGKSRSLAQQLVERGREAVIWLSAEAR